MKPTNHDRTLNAAVLPLLLCWACSSATDDGAVGVAQAQLTLAPTNAKCLVIQAQGSSTVTQQFNVSPEANSVFDLSGLPLGVDSFTAKAYDVACSAINGASPTYTSAAAVTATVTANGTPVSLTFQMQPVSPAGGNATAGLNFEPSTHGVVTEFLIPNIGAVGAPSALRITAGPGGLWFTEATGGLVGLMTTNGTVSQFQPAQSSAQQGIAAGPDGNLWFAVGTGIERVGVSGVPIQEGVVTSGGSPFSITAGADGNLWFTETGGSNIGRITPSGVLTEFPGAAGLNGICAGPDGNMWFTDGGKIGRIGTNGKGLREFSLPSQNSDSTQIAVGADGNLWFTEFQNDQIGRITTNGVVTEFPVPTAESEPWGIVAGPDGNVWFTELQANQIGRITPSGAVTEFAVPRPDTAPFSIAAGPDGNLWFTELGSDSPKIGRITP